MGTIYTPSPNLSAFNQPSANPLESISRIFDNNQINAANLMKQKLQNAEMMNYQSKVSEEQAKADQRSEAARQAQTLSEIFAPSLPQVAGAGGTPAVPGMSVADKLNDPNVQGKINNAVINLSLKAGQPSADIANLLRTVYAQSAVPDATMARAVVGAGEKLGENDALSISGQDRIRAGNVANTIAINNARPLANTFVMPPGTNLDDLTAPSGTPASGRTLYENAENSTGPLSALSNEVANVAGFAGGTLYPETVQGRQDLETFATRFANSLRTNAKFTEGERKDLAKRISLAPGMGTSAPFLRQKMISVDNSLADMERKTSDDISDPLMSKADRQASEANLRNIREYRMQLGVPPAKLPTRGSDNKINITQTPAERAASLIDGKMPAGNTGGWSAVEVQ